MLTTAIGKIHYMDTLAIRIKRTREKRGMKPQDLADAAGVSRAAVVLWENGQTKNIRLEHLFAAAHALKVQPEWLAIGRGSQDIEPEKFNVEAMLNSAIKAYTYLYDSEGWLTPADFRTFTDVLYFQELEGNPITSKKEISNLLRLVK